MKLLKRSLFIFISLTFFIFSLFPLPVQAVNAGSEEEELTLYAASAVLMDAESGRILYEKNGHQILPMASTTKIMTCILALEYGRLSDYVKISSYAASMPKVKLGVCAGEYYLLEDLLYSLMLESHNDAAVAIAEHIAGSTDAFANMMNQKALEIGCTDTFFITPNGLDATATDKAGNARVHSTTAADLARIMSYCITYSPKKEQFLEITQTASKTIRNYQEREACMTSGNRSFFLNNHNAFLTMMEGALSGKTGFTGNAGYCYVGSLRRDERTYVVALLACGWPNHKSYKWSDTTALMNYGLTFYDRHLFSEYAYDPAQLSPIPVVNGQTLQIGQTAYTGVRVEKREVVANTLFSSDSLLLREDENIQVICQTLPFLSAPVSSGTKVGTIRYMLGNDLWKVEDIFTCDTIPAIDFSWCLSQLLSIYLL